jgi:hypothetical protein
MTTWSFAGTTLTDLGRVTILNDYLDTAERRGENILLPFRHGRTFVQKYYEERVISIGLAINVASATALESRLDTIKRLFSSRAQGTLSQTLEDATIRTSLATIDSPFQIERKKDSLALAVLDFRLTEPFFRSSVQYAGTATINAGTVTLNIVNSGSVEERDPVITYIGPLNNPVITNPLNSHTLSYAGSIAATVVVQKASTGEYTALAGTTNVIGNLTHSGGAALMVLNAAGTTNGTNALSITNTGGTTGQIIISFYTPYL